VRTRWRRALLAVFDHHGLDRGDHAVRHLDLHLVGPDALDRVVEVDLAAVDPDAAGLADRLRDVLGGDRAE
jgi:hypothetical protein